MNRFTLFAAAFGLTAAATLSHAAEMKVVEGGVAAAPIITPENPPPSTAQAAEELADYIKKMSGARPPVLQGAPDPPPERAIWVGDQPAAKRALPEANLDFDHPEEIMYFGDGRNLVIAGRDAVANEEQFEHGTANAVYTFMQRELGIRWLWPGELGTEVPKADTIGIAPVEYRFHPPIRERKMWRGSYGGEMGIAADAWYRFNRLTLGSLACHGGHAYTDWWERYGEEHPEYFALLPSRERTPQRHGQDIKLCVSNPEVGQRWLSNAVDTFREDPSLRMLSASPNDGPGFCVCDRCRAMDPPDGPPMWGYVALTDRYVKYWNTLARGLREALPEREAFVGAYAYSAYKTPPVAEDLEPNIAIGYVGHFPLAGDEVTEREKDDWKAWADKATLMFYRPNLFHYSGGWLGLTDIAMRRTFRDFRFLAENRCVGLQVDTLPQSWATQGIQIYTMAQFAYDPFQDGEAMLDDYFRKGFGPAAEQVAAYFDHMEAVHDSVVSNIRHSSGWAREAVAVYQRFYTADALDTAERLLDEAAANTADAEPRYSDRVAFIRSGFDFIRLQVRIMHVMQRVRETQGRDTAAVREATELCEKRERLYSELWPTFAIRGSRWYYESRRMADYMGPPSEELLQSTAEEEARLAPAEWEPAWSDAFDRDELGGDWRVVEGTWRIENGALTSSGGGRLVTTRSFPGLHRFEFEASITADPGGVISDMDPILRSDAAGSGYLMQFGGYYNTKNSIQKKGTVLAESETPVIEPGKVYTIVAEMDGNTLRLEVDRETVLEHQDRNPLLDEEHGHIGFYVYQGNIRIEKVNVYTATPVRKPASEMDARQDDPPEAWD